MAMTTEQYMAVYGIDEQGLQECYGADSFNMVSGRDMLVMSIMSDAQHLMAHGNLELARQLLNRAKWVLSNVTERQVRAAQLAKAGITTPAVYIGQ